MDSLFGVVKVQCPILIHSYVSCLFECEGVILASFIRVLLHQDALTGVVAMWSKVKFPRNAILISSSSSYVSCLFGCEQQAVLSVSGAMLLWACSRL